MKKTIKIKGMDNTACQGQVEKALLGLEGVSSADADYKTGIAVVTLNSEVPDAVFIRAIERLDFKVIEIK
ncbi:MAG: heavy-metal-associated domain-containing protein [Butyrivibrio sp.]|nr:heavy-metal-associated domain-containing protein [Butyrivibrio sp.]